MNNKIKRFVSNAENGIENIPFIKSELIKNQSFTRDWMAEIHRNHNDNDNVINSLVRCIFQLEDDGTHMQTRIIVMGSLTNRNENTRRLATECMSKWSNK